MTWRRKAHLAPGPIDKDHASLCNVIARKWAGKKLVKVDVRIVDKETFKKLTFAEQCGRCFLVMCSQDGIPVVRQR